MTRFSVFGALAAACARAPSPSEPGAMAPDEPAPAASPPSPPPAEQCVDRAWEQVRTIGHPPEPIEGAFSLPSGVATDPETGDVYVSDNLFKRVQRFDADGRFLGAWRVPVGIAVGLTVDPTDHSVLLAVPGKKMLVRFTPDGKDVGRLGPDLPAAEALLEPQDAAVDPTSGRVYVINNDSRVTVLEKDGRFVRSWHAGVRARPAGPLGNYDKSLGIAVTLDGKRVYVANSGAYRVAAFTPEGTLLQRWADKSSSKPGELRWCRGVAVGPDGRVYVADTDNERAQIFDADGRFLAAFRGPHENEPIGFHPRAIDVNAKTGKVWVAAAYANRVDRFDADGRFEMSIGKPQPSPAVLNDARGVVVDAARGRLFVTSRRDHLVKRFTLDGRFEKAFHANAGPLEGFDPSWTVQQNHQFPTPLALGRDGSVWLTRQGYHYPDDPTPGHYLRHYSAEGDFLGAIEHPEMAGYMEGLEIDPYDGSFFVASGRHKKVLRFDEKGGALPAIGAGAGLVAPTGLAWDPIRARLYVLDTNAHRVRVFDAAGAEVGGWGEKGKEKGQFAFAKPAGADVDPCGRVYVADYQNRRVQIFDAEGRFLDQVVLARVEGEGRPRPWDVDVVGDEMYVVGGDRVMVFRRTARPVAPVEAGPPEEAGEIEEAEPVREEEE